MCRTTKGGALKSLLQPGTLQRTLASSSTWKYSDKTRALMLRGQRCAASIDTLVDVVAAKVERVRFRAVRQQDQSLVEVLEPREFCARQHWCMSARRTVILVVAMLADDHRLERAIARRPLALRAEVDGLEWPSDMSRASPRQLLGEVADDQAVVARLEDIAQQREMHVERASVLSESASRFWVIEIAQDAERRTRGRRRASE